MWKIIACDDEKRTHQSKDWKPEKGVFLIPLLITDDDGHAMFIGWADETWFEGSQDVAFEPLDVAAADYGATTLSYFCPTTKKWRVL